MVIWCFSYPKLRRKSWANSTFVTDLLLLAETGASLEERRRPDTTALLDANILAGKITGLVH